MLASAPYNPPYGFASFKPSLGSGSLKGNFSAIGGSAGAFSMSYTGQEIGRVFMPEPGGNWLAGTALASLSGMALLRTRRRLSV